MFQLKCPHLIFRTLRDFARPNRSLSSVPPKSPSYDRLPHILQPRVLLGSSLIACSYFCYLWYFDNEKAPSDYPRDFEAVVYRRLPINTYSHFLGKVRDVNIPSYLRGLVYGTYIKLTHCNMAEAKESDIHKYATLGELFSRELASGVRPLDPKALINSPCDGTVVCAGQVDSQKRLLEQVKGSTYHMGEFLGPLPESQLSRKDRQLYQCVIYLSPGDCHRFYSPTDWTVKTRRHFTGKLLSVRPSLTKKLPGIFTLNERVVYLGSWDHGFMSLTAVGAAGVGSIVAAGDLDPTLRTNLRSLPSSEAREPGQHFHEVALTAGRRMPLGAPFGHFRMGSTIVLVFEAPRSGFEWTVKSGDKIKFGEALMRPEKRA